jgi:glyoxylase-like metal-dependent hydrolase (beta-lactamase superfamily II)
MSSWRGRALGYDVSAFLMRGVLVDTGFPEVSNDLVDAVRALEPRGAVVTHWHEDHAGSAPAIARMGVPLLMHARCEDSLRARPMIRLYRRLVWGQTERLSVPLVGFDQAPLQVIETPGHSPDHLVVWDAERGIVASGDLFLGVKVRVAHTHESPRTLVQSLRSVAALEPRLLLDAHRGAVSNATELLRVKIAWMEETIGQIASLAAQGVHEQEIQRRVLGNEALVGYASAGEYSKISLVRAVLHERAGSMPRLTSPV